MHFELLKYLLFLALISFLILQALSHVPPLRDYFLREENYSQIKRPPGDKMVRLTQRFGELVRKLWNPRNFKAHVSPHEMLQASVLCSNKRFQFTEQGLSAILLSVYHMLRLTESMYTATERKRRAL